MRPNAIRNGRAGSDCRAAGAPVDDAVNPVNDSHMQAEAFSGWRNGRVILAIALMYLLVLKAVLAPFALGSTGFASAFPDAVICGSHDADANVPADQAPAAPNLCCDDGCLLRLLGFVAPLLAFVALTFRITRMPIRAAWRTFRQTAGPPLRLVALSHAQRAPPAVYC